MSGDEEARVRASLVEMQQRISKGPHNALGVTNTATHEDVRAAFLALTKRFHPARFARMSSELQKFSNEVFLGIRSAHDTLVSGSLLRASVSKSGAFPIVADGSGSTRTISTAAMQPSQRPPAPRAVGTIPAGTVPTGPIPAGTRVPTPIQGQPALRPSPTTPAPQAPRSPPHPSQVMNAISPPTLRYNEPNTRPAPSFNEDAALAQATELIKAKSWSAARQALHTLAARVPQSKHYRALLCYTRGREAQAANRPDEAQLEFQRALQLEPELAQAKQALSEIQRRR